jgi:hypothetical protein
MNKLYYSHIEIKKGIKMLYIRFYHTDKICDYLQNQRKNK